MLTSKSCNFYHEMLNSYNQSFKQAEGSINNDILIQ